MNAIRCPQCNLVNQLSATYCQQCGFPFSNVSQTAYVSVPTQEIYEAKHSGFDAPIAEDDEIGRKTFFWYRVYCGVLAALYLLIMAGGIFLVFYKPATREYTPEEAMIMGGIYAVLGGVFLVAFAVALFLPRKPYNWIVGIVMMAIGMTSCCFVPFLIPLFIYWLKPETKAFFGRK